MAIQSFCMQQATNYASAHITSIAEGCKVLKEKSRPLDVAIENRTQFTVQRTANGEYWDSGKVFGGNFQNIPPLSRGNIAVANSDSGFMTGVSGAVSFSLVENETQQKVADFVLGFSHPFSGAAKLGAGFTTNAKSGWDNIGSSASASARIFQDKYGNKTTIELHSFPGSPNASLSIVQKS